VRHRLTVLVTSGLLALSACSGDDPAATPPASPGTSPSASPSASASPSEPGPPALPIGKSDLLVPGGEHQAPEGFRPRLRLIVTEGWTSVHRDVDGFDFGVPDPDRDAPLVALVFLTPPESSAAEALAAVRSRANGTVRAIGGRIGSIRASGLDILGGRGELVSSVDGGIALDAAPGQRLHVLAADVDGTPLLVVILVPDAEGWGPAYRRARGMLDSVRPL
jgi:hypothetical protein